MKRILIVRESDDSLTVMAENGVRAKIFYQEGDAPPVEYIPRLSTDVMDAALPRTKAQKPVRVAMPSVTEMTQALRVTAQAMQEASPPSAPRRRPGVTDHARIRYLMRKKGLDVSALDAEILSPAVTAAIHLGAASVRKDGYRYVFAESGAVVTIVEVRIPRPRRSGRRLPRDERAEIAECLEDAS